MIRSIRVSSGSLQSWVLYGPIDQALKTTCQADAMRCFSLTVPVSGTEIGMDLWISASCRRMTLEDHGKSMENFSPLGHLILVRELLRRKGVFSPELMEEDALLDVLTDIIANTDAPLVAGKVVLTGAGGEDVPDVDTRDLIRGLLGAGIEF